MTMIAETVPRYRRRRRRHPINNITSVPLTAHPTTQQQKWAKTNSNSHRNSIYQLPRRQRPNPHPPPQPRTINTIHSSSNSGFISLLPPLTWPPFSAASLQPQNQLSAINSSRHGREQLTHSSLIQQRLNFLANTSTRASINAAFIFDRIPPAMESAEGDQFHLTLRDTIFHNPP